ncbi:hypothetical protein CK228_16440 [Mesorhizobium sp. WSM4312]|nr:hypothetical protein CK228_16440 [Mesorhizobium sp. WSM4312]
MTAQVIADSFQEFLEIEFLASSKNPYDEMTILAHKKLGAIEKDTHLIYKHSILLGGEETIDNVEKIGARTAMICNGDIATQLDAGPPNGAVRAIEPYEDDAGRMRLRLLWS